MHAKFISFSVPLLLILLSSIFYLFSGSMVGGYVGSIYELFVLTLFVGYLFSLYYVSPGFLVTSFVTVIYWLGLIVSALVIGHGVYLIEIAEYGARNGVLSFYVIAAVCHLELARLGYRFASAFFARYKFLRLPAIIDRLTPVAMLGLVFLIMLSIFMIYGSPVLLGVDRVAFWSEVPFPLSLGRSLYYQSLIFVALKVCFLVIEARKGRAIFLIFVYSVIMIFVMGEKFSGWMIAFGAFLSVLPGFVVFRRLRVKYVAVGLLVFFLLIAYVLYNYLAQGHGYDFLLTRLGLQGQIGWSIIRHGDVSFSPGEYVSCSFGCAEFGDARDLVSFKYATPLVYWHYLETGSTLSGFLPGLHVYLFGLILFFILSAVVSFGVGFFQRALVVAASSENYIATFLVYKIVFGLYLVWYTANAQAVAMLVLSFILFLLMMAFSRRAHLV